MLFRDLLTLSAGNLLKAHCIAPKVSLLEGIILLSEEKNEDFLKMFNTTI